jgi:catechol 2,3-dioxygenase
VPQRTTRKRKSPAAALMFNHAMVYVRELAPALRFYADLLGFQVIEQFGPAYARLRSAGGQTTLALHTLEPGQALPGTDGVRLYFETRELDRVCRDLQAAGVQFRQLPQVMPWGWKHAYLHDPDGREVSLYWAGRKRFQKSKIP